MEHYGGRNADGDCLGNVGLIEGEQAAVWQLGYAEEWNGESGGTLIAQAEAGRGSEGGWTAVGSASFEENTLSYTFDPIQFFVFTD